MAILEMYMLTGHVAVNADQLQSQSPAVKRVDVDETKIILYLDEVWIFTAPDVYCVNIY